MIFPWMFDEIHALKPFKEVAHILSEKKDWARLYDTKALNNNKVVYSDSSHATMTVTLHALEDVYIHIIFSVNSIHIYGHRYLLQPLFTMKTCT